MMAQALTLSRPWAEINRTAAQLKLRGAEVLRAHPRETIGFGMFGLVAAAAIGTAVATAPGFGGKAQATPPAPPPLLMRNIAPQQALHVNAEIPVAQGPNPAAVPFRFTGNQASRGQALNCLASAVYYEAGNQDEAGERAVAQVVLNRVRHPAFPNSICGVVYQGSTRPTGCQFTFTCDGSLARQPGGDAWRRAWKVAEEALSGSVYAPVGWATHYHADYVLPTWASSMAKNAIVGAHLFYRWSGSWGQAAAFADGYAGREPNAAALRLAALAAPHVTPFYGAQGQLDKAIQEIPGAQALKLAPSMRGDKRVAVRFNLVARNASKDVVAENYTKKFEASDNLKYALSSDATAPDQKPLGEAAIATPAASGSGSAAARP
jgi:spore germination cell wall hydrolase CwlJ-like protein